MQGEAPSWLGSSSGCRCLPAVCFPAVALLHASSRGEHVKDTGMEAETRDTKKLVLFLGKANWHFQEALCLVSLKSSARCSWWCSRLGSLTASFQTLYFCEKPGACSSFIPASSDAAHMGAAQTHLEQWHLCTLLRPFLSPLLALSCVSNGNIRVMTVLQDSRSCVCVKANHNYLPPLRDLRQRGEIIAMKSLSCNTVWVQLQHIQAVRGLLSRTCVIADWVFMWWCPKDELLSFSL